MTLHPVLFVSLLLCFQFALCRAQKEPEVACDHFYILSLRLKRQKKREKDGGKGEGGQRGEKELASQQFSK